jgi:hypothetical protein
MTATVTTTQKPLTVPPAGLRFDNGTVVITAMYVNAAGYKVQVRINGEHQPHLGGLYTFEDGPNGALAAYNTLVAQYEAEPAPAEAPAPVAEVKPIAGNHSGSLHVSDPSHTVLAIAAMNPDGIVHRGGGLGKATDTQIRAMARKGYLELIPKKGGSAFAISGGRITDKGRRRLAELTAAEREAVRLNAALAA